jgi:membrane protease subunit HflK
MPWQNSGGGGGGGGPWGGGQSPWGRGPQPPNLEDILRRGQDRFRRYLPGNIGGGRGIILIAIGIVLLWLASGFYRVQPDEEGIVLRFGAFDRRSNPGLNYHLPSPIEEALTPKVTRVNRIEIGFKTTGEATTARGQGGRQVDEEALMLTGDENIVDINFTVFWLIKDAKAYLFNIRNQELTVKAAAESAMREVIGHTEIARAFAEARGRIKVDTLKLMQEVLDAYGSGIEITDLNIQKVDPPGQVIDSFRDVQSAKIDLNRLVNEAQAYRNDVVPRAHGDASRVVQEAEAYRQQVVRQADGEASRFLSVYQSYKAAEDITARRLYIETIESILKNTNKVILDKAATSSGVLPYLPLTELGVPARPASPSATPQPGGTPAPPTVARGSRP